MVLIGKTLQFGTYPAIWNTKLGTALNPLNAHGLLAL